MLHSSLGGHRDGFHFRAFVSSAEVNTDVQVSLWQGLGLLSSSDANVDLEVRETLRDVLLWGDMFIAKEKRRKKFPSVASNIRCRKSSGT